MQSPCCLQWYECAECHDEANEDHIFKFALNMKMCCKACKKVFMIDFLLFSDKDKSCSSCGNRWVIPGHTPERKVYEESLAYLDACLTAHIDPTNNPYFSQE